MKVAALVCRLNAGQQPMPVQPSLYELRGVIRRSLLASRGDVLFNGPFDTDLFVIGGGSGRVRAARIASQHGARVTLAEEDRLGGTCVIRGYVPKKLMVYASKVGHEAKDSRTLAGRRRTLISTGHCLGRTSTRNSIAWRTRVIAT
jgi:hypothetical protein